MENPTRTPAQAHRPPAPPASAPAIGAVGALLALAVAYIHVADQGGFPGDKSPAYIAIGYYVLEVVAAWSGRRPAGRAQPQPGRHVAAGGRRRRRTDARLHPDPRPRTARCHRRPRQLGRADRRGQPGRRGPPHRAVPGLRGEPAHPGPGRGPRPPREPPAAERHTGGVDTGAALLLVEDDRRAGRACWSGSSARRATTSPTPPTGSGACTSGSPGRSPCWCIDRGLPAIEGLDLLTRLRSKGVGTPALVLSAPGQHGGPGRRPGRRRRGLPHQAVRRRRAAGQAAGTAAAAHRHRARC